MAVRSKMSTARTRMGRAVTKTTSNDGSDRGTNPNISPTDKMMPGWLYGNEGTPLRRLTESEQRKLDAEYDQTFPGSRKKDEHVIISSTDKSTYKDVMSGNRGMYVWKKPETETTSTEPTVKKPTKEEMAADLKASASKVKPKDKFLPLKKVEPGSKRDLITKDKEDERDIQVPETVSGPKGRTKSKTKLGFTYKPTLAAKTGKQMKQERVGDWKDTDLIERMSGLQKPSWNYSRRGLSTYTKEVPKNARLSERIKYKKEEKLAGARERVLGMSGVALKDQANKYGKAVKRGEKLQEGSAQRLKDLKSLYGGEKEEVIGGLSGTSSGKTRVEALKGAKSDIKEIGKLSKSYVKERKAVSGKKGEAMVKAKSMMAEAKSAAKPKKFSKDTGVSGLEEDLKAMKSAKSPAEIKAMKSSARTAMKEARGMKRTAEERAQTRSAVKATRGTAKEARSFKGDIRKGLRMEKKDTRAINVAATASEAKKTRKAAKGKTMKGTSYFSMTELNKTIPLKGAADVAKYKEPKLMTKSDIKEYAKSGKNVKLGKILEAGKNIKTGARQYSSSQGNMQAGARRFSKK